MCCAERSLRGTRIVATAAAVAAPKSGTWVRVRVKVGPGLP